MDQIIFSPTKVHVLKGPGIEVTLDPNEVFPDDPGRGTPMMVSNKKHSASFHCAINEYELGLGEYRLSSAQIKWLQDIEDVVLEWEIQAFDHVRNNPE